MKTKLAFLILILISIILPKIGKAQTALEIVWQKDSSPNVIDFAKISPDGKFIYGGGGGFVYKFSTENGDVIRAFDNTIAGSIYDLRISASGNYITTEDGDGHLYLWDVKAEKCLKEIKLPNQKEYQKIGLGIVVENDSIMIVQISNYENQTLPYAKFYKYNWITESILDTSSRIYAGVSNFEISHDFNDLAIGIGYTINGNEKRRRLMIWDAENFKEKSVLEDTISNKYYERILFSPDDSKLMIMKIGATNETRIFDIDKIKLLFNIDVGHGCNFLPDNIHFLLFYANFDGHRLELRENDKVLQEINNTGRIIENVTREGEHYVFCTSGSDFTLLKPSSTAVNEDKIGYEIKIDEKYITIFFKSIAKISSILISDLNGKVQYSQKHDNYSEGVILIPNSFQTGTYICSVTDNNGKTYSEKFQVVR